MIQSMTGYGRAEAKLADYLVTVDIKSLNGKQFDLTVRLPISLKQFEIEIKNMLQQKLGRGSIEIFISLKQHGSSKPMKVNTELAKFYFDAMQQVSKEIGQPIDNSMQVLMSMPEVVSQSADEISEQDWATIQQTIEQAITALTTQRIAEGKSLENHLKSCNTNILAHAASVQPYEAGRATKQKEKLLAALQENAGNQNVDLNRLEQEIIYYLEKFDISEEQIRLKHHCDFFIAEIDNAEIQKGKKIGFILQEMGREINTMGSKANDVNIQQLVVAMKDELEKAKEQSLNVL
jgi:uncharacterized protein (TIGR00255 family)